ncbi:hypothetical protein Goklo_021924 [Gossypium klotzschianum]|uniref:STAS domain-containing protein n=1 Tax=Gossypium klotzschianum TaxID=34286 RepID=A0A7J8TKX4_9ROSI|nr:hypothetical protein [Gossypium klotzschianum]
MGGTAIIISLQQMRGILGLKNFTTRTDVVRVIQAIFHNRNEVCTYIHACMHAYIEHFTTRTEVVRLIQAIFHHRNEFDLLNLCSGSGKVLLLVWSSFVSYKWLDMCREPEYMRLREEVTDLEVSSTQSRQAPQHVQPYPRLGRGFISQLSRKHEYMRLPEEVTNLLGKSALLDRTARGTQPPTKRNGDHLPMKPFLVLTMCFLQRQRKPNLFWVSAISPMAVVAVGCLYAYLGHGEQHGIAIVGDLKKGLNPSSIHYLNFDSRYLPATIRAGVVTGLISMVEGIAIGRSFAIIKNEQIDGNKEMIAYGFMNIIGSLTSCYLTTGPFSKTAVNVNSGCKTPMANVVQGFCMMLTLLFLAPIFSYTPLVALAAIIMSAMLGLINYEEMYHLYKVDKFDFAICMAAFFGVSFGSMDIGLLLSVGLSLLRALLYVARPAACKLGRLPNTSLYRDTEQYPETMSLEGILVLQLGSPVYFANCSYIRERYVQE